MIYREAKKLVYRKAAALIADHDIAVDMTRIDDGDIERIVRAREELVNELHERGHGIWRGKKRTRKQRSA